MTIDLKPTFLLGLDLGQRNDYTALSVLRQRQVHTGDPEYDVIHLDRWRGRSYHEVAGEVRRLFPMLRQRIHDEVMADDNWSGSMPDAPVVTKLIVDGTGVGVPVVDSLRAAGLACTAITIHGGESVSQSGGDYRVPKRDLVSVLQVLLQNRRLRLAKKLPLTSVLEQELQNFRAKISLKTGHDTYGAGEDWRDGNHDDLVLSIGMAAWYGEHHDPRGWDDLDTYMQQVS